MYLFSPLVLHPPSSASSLFAPSFLLFLNKQLFEYLLYAQASDERSGQGNKTGVPHFEVFVEYIRKKEKENTINVDLTVTSHCIKCQEDKIHAFTWCIVWYLAAIHVYSPQHPVRYLAYPHFTDQKKLVYVCLNLKPISLHYIVLPYREQQNVIGSSALWDGVDCIYKI